MALAACLFNGFADLIRLLLVSAVFNVVGRVDGARDGEAARRFRFQHDRARIDAEFHFLKVRTIDRDGQIKIVGIFVARG